MSSEQPSVKSHKDGLAVIHVAMNRMATLSLTRAYRTLGYRVHHGTDDGIYGNPYSGLEEAAEATWPNVPGARPRAPFTREDWDLIFGSEYDMATDLASPFVEQLIPLYPNAKIVVVQRDFESWWPSYHAGVVVQLFAPMQKIVLLLCQHVLGIRAGPAMHKTLLGQFSARNVSEIEANARQTYDEYYRRIRELVPPEQRLEFKPGDGWEPLCAFLGKEVPDVPFPHENDRQTHHNQTREVSNTVVWKSVYKMAQVLLPVAVAGCSAWYVWK
ncbi:hypothetical protein F5Y16DRAFT_312138 [Xylariaceae sp. FL0255]|nr:hypothetical protein F5Y16DRAFT_312138 [Xylariaceae sp. FL0255]